MTYKLPIFATIADGYRFLIAQFTGWFQLAIAPLVICIGLNLANGWLAGENMGASSDTPTLADMLLNAPFILAHLVIAATLLMYAVALHRLVLGANDRTGPLAWLAWRSRHWRYVGQGVVIVAIILLGAIVTATFVPAIGTVAGTAGVLESAAGQVTLTFVVLILFAVPIALLSCMVLPALPAAAVDDHAVSLSEASNQAKGNLWRMTIIFALGVMLPFWLIEKGVGLLTSRTATRDGLPELITPIVINFIAFTVTIVLLSLIYRRLRDNTTLRADVPAR
ncbi:MAG: hypothetical protein O3B37_04090 [Proteobacteria bacterium]|nr:hypothetical protein [Pseudomonadota bacterium]